MSESDAGKGDLQRRIQDQPTWDEQHLRTFGVLRKDWPKCDTCKQPFIFEEDEPFAYCDCGTTEWGSRGRPGNWKVRQRDYLNRSTYITERDPGDENDSKA